MRLGKVALGLLMMIFLAMSVSAVAGDRKWVTFDSDEHQSRRVPYTGRWDDFVSNCSITGSADNQPVVDDLDGDGDVDIVLTHTNVLKVVDRQCEQIDAVGVSGLGNRQPVIYASNNCASGKSIYVLTNETAQEWCFDDATGLSIETNISSSGTIDDFKGMAMDNYYNIRGAYLVWDGSKYDVEIADFDTGSATTLSLNNITWLGTDVLPVGDIDSDDDDDFVVGSSVLDMIYYSDFDRNNANLNRSDELQVLHGTYDRTGNNYIMFEEHSGTTQEMVVLDYLGTEIYSGGYGGNQFLSNVPFVQLGKGGDVCFQWKNDPTGYLTDNLHVRCVTIQTGTVTFDYGGLSVFSSGIPFTCADLDADGYADFMFDNGDIALYDNGTLDWVMELDDEANEDIHTQHILYALKLGSDNYRDIVALDVDSGTGLKIYSTDYTDADYDLLLELTNCSTGDPLEFTFVNVTGTDDEDFTNAQGQVAFYGVGEGSFDVKVGDNTIYGVDSEVGGSYQQYCIGAGDVGCGSLPSCSYPSCLFKDDFEYSCDLEDIGWNLYPSKPDLEPVDGRHCYEASGTGTHYSQWMLTAYVDLQVISTEFDMQIKDNDTLSSFEFVHYDGTSDQYRVPVYLRWRDDENHTYLYRYDGSNQLICQDCWNRNESHHYKIVQFHENTGNAKFYNQSSDDLELIDSNSFAVIIDDNESKSYYNLPNYQTLDHNHSNLLNDITWSWYNEEICLDNVNVYEGFTEQYVVEGCTNPEGDDGQLYCYEGDVYECSQDSWTNVYSCGGDAETGNCEYVNYAVRSFDNYSSMCEQEEVSECTNHPISYTSPTIWADYFQYNYGIFSSGWDGYDFIIGENPDNSCDILFYDMDLYDEEIGYELDSPVSQDFTITFDLWPDSSITETTYDLCGSPTQFYGYDSEGDVVLYAIWGTADGPEDYCNITTQNTTHFYDIGYWDGGAINSYKIDVNFTSQSYDFYFTTQDNIWTFVNTSDGQGIGFYDPTATEIARFAWKPVTPRSTYQQGFWLDDIRVRLKTEEQDVNATNYCYFEGCIFHDHFDYNNSVLNHGWWWGYEIIPSNSIATISQNDYGYYFSHTFNTFRSSDADGIISFQFRAKIGEKVGTTYPHFLVWSNDLTTRYMDFNFVDGVIYDLMQNPSLAVGEYTENAWLTYTIVLDLIDNQYDFYIGSNKVVENVQLPGTASGAVGQLGFATDGTQIDIDYITVSKGDEVAEDFVTGGTGVSSEHLKNCWEDGDFDWSGCCTAEEDQEKSYWCPTRVTFFWIVASITNFILNYFLYFIVIAIIFVLITPYIVPGIKR